MRSPLFSKRKKSKSTKMQLVLRRIYHNIYYVCRMKYIYIYTTHLYTYTYIHAYRYMCTHIHMRYIHIDTISLNATLYNSSYLLKYIHIVQYHPSAKLQKILSSFCYITVLDHLNITKLIYISIYMLFILLPSLVLKALNLYAVYFGRADFS